MKNHYQMVQMVILMVTQMVQMFMQMVQIITPHGLQLVIKKSGENKKKTLVK